MEKVKLQIRINSCATNDPCAVCGERTDPNIGPTIFLAGTYEPVCNHCAKRIDPDVYQSWRDICLWFESQREPATCF